MNVIYREMQKLINEIKKTRGDMARRGWAESNDGNISLRLKEEYYEYFNKNKPFPTSS
jgi:ribulose-5-phosphate 4-epimerase/fuculose-1-phosphate aldolase